MAKIIQHPSVNQYLENKIINIAKNKEAPFKDVDRTKNDIFNKFMDKADEMFKTDKAKDLEKETFLFHKALKENPEYIELSKQIGKMVPKTTAQVAEYREK